MTMPFTDFILCAAPAKRIHGTDDAIRETCYRCRDRVSMQNRSLLSRLMRHDRVGEWLDKVLEQM